MDQGPLSSFEPPIAVLLPPPKKKKLHAGTSAKHFVSSISEIEGERKRQLLRLYKLPTHTYQYRICKRIFDLALCCALLPLGSLLFAAVGLIVMVTSGFPVLYRQERIGQRGKPFTLYKFRTMRNGSAQLLADWLVQNPEAFKEWQQTRKLKKDPRITRGGRFLRETSLDELPQIINVIRGEMSLVGPRPVTEAELEKYGKRVVYYSAAVPGLTGLWQVSGRCGVTYQQRVRMDETYVRRWTLLQDLIILLRTPRSVLRRDGAC